MLTIKIIVTIKKSCKNRITIITWAIESRFMEKIENQIDLQWLKA